MLMTERYGLSCREFRYRLREDEIREFLSRVEPLLSDPSFHSDQWLLRTVYLSRPDAPVGLRLRGYLTPEGTPSSPLLWVESKRREGSSSELTRFPLQQSLVARFLQGDLREEEILACQDRFVERERLLRAVRRVRRIAGPGPLSAAGERSFLRLAVEGGTPLARLTLDRNIACHSGDETREEPGAVVELKYRCSRRPHWCDPYAGPAGLVELSRLCVLA